MNAEPQTTPDPQLTVLESPPAPRREYRPHGTIAFSCPDSTIQRPVLCGPSEGGFSDSTCHWEFLFQQTLRFAQYQIDRLSWRGDSGGVLPDGFDANSIAAQAIMDFLALNDSTVQRCNDLTASQHEINRFVLKHVTRLHHRKENFLVRNAEDLNPVLDMDDEPISVLELIPAPDVQPDNALLHAESVIQVHELKSSFEAFLAKERRLINLFELTCDGTSKPQALATCLKLSVRTVENLQKRLQRRWRTFLCPSSTRK